MLLVKSNMALMIQISSDTGGNSLETADITIGSGGFLPSSGNYGDHWHRILIQLMLDMVMKLMEQIMELVIQLLWELLIGGAGVTRK